MLQFQKAEKNDLGALKPYFAAQRTHLSDFSLGFQFMWNDALRPDYAVAGDCLILREFYTGRYYFHYPLSLSGSEEAETAAIAAIEQYCRDTDTRLHFTNVPRAKLAGLVLRYGQEVSVSNVRRWRDYLYRAEDFKEYPGKRYAGQRNHVNKFLKNNPAWSFRPYTPEDEPAVRAFLKTYEAVQRAKKSFLAEEEMDEVYEILPRFAEFGIVAGLLFSGGKIVAFTAGERCGDTLVVHIEKALRDCEGAYPFVAQQFARAFCGEGVDYLNRMDDAGDGGLRKSKLQYLPCEIVDKYTVIPGRAIDLVSREPVVQTERLTLRRVRDEDEAAYARLASDVGRNRYWGYDWREDCPVADPPARYYLECAREDFKRRREMPLGVYCGKKLVGEAVLHRFGYAGEAEIGVRLLPEEEGKGYACEAVRALTEYAFLKLGAERVEAKCFRENERSRKMLLAAGMRAAGEDGTYFYFYRTPAM